MLIIINMDHLKKQMNHRITEKNISDEICKNLDHIFMQTTV